MNKRAIIAKEINNGYFTSWCWANGDYASMGSILYKYFLDSDVVDELISYRSILGLFTKPAEDKDKILSGNFAKLSNGIYVKYDDGAQKSVVGGLNGFMRSVNEILGQEVSHMYIFHNGIWRMYKK